MNEIIIKKKIIKEDDSEQAVYQVPALSIKNSQNETAFQVPHPQGTSGLEYSTLEEAVLAVKNAGFNYILPQDASISEEKMNELLSLSSTKNDLEEFIFNKLASQKDNMSVSVVASAIMGLAELRTPSAIDIFLEKIGEDNDKIRNAAIDALVEFQECVVDRLIDALTDSNWVKRNSAITCLTKIANTTELELEKVLIPILNRIQDTNQIVQANALYSAGKIYSLQLGFKLNKSKII